MKIWSQWVMVLLCTLVLCACSRGGRTVEENSGEENGPAQVTEINLFAFDYSQVVPESPVVGLDETESFSLSATATGSGQRYYYWYFYQGTSEPVYSGLAAHTLSKEEMRALACEEVPASDYFDVYVVVSLEELSTESTSDWESLERILVWDWSVTWDGTCEASTDGEGAETAAEEEGTEEATEGGESTSDDDD